MTRPDITSLRDGRHFTFIPRTERADVWLAGVFQDFERMGIAAYDLTPAMATEIIAWARQQGFVVEVRS